MFSPRLYFNIFLMGLSIFIFISSLTLKTGKAVFVSSSAMLPLSLSIMMLLISIYVFFKELKLYKKTDEQMGPQRPIFFIGYIAMVFVAVFLMNWIPFYIVSIVFLTVSFLYLKAGTILRSVIVSVIFVGLVVVIFEKIFQVIFP